MGLLFFPRGGSAHVARNLAAALPAAGWDATVLSGSARPDGDATAFYAGLDVHALDMTRALTASDPMAADPPLHPSYENRPDAPDRWMASLDEAELAHQVEAWSGALLRAGAPDADVLHLHHLTPLHEAAARVAPQVPVIGHLHGTELLMLEQLEPGHPWRRRLTRWAERCERFVVLSEGQAERVGALLGVGPERCTWIPNGFDPAAFGPRPAGGAERLAHWRRHLADAPRGWRPGAGAGSVTYEAAEVEAAFAPGHPVLLYVGRFTSVKRTALLIEAHQRAQAAARTRMPLVLLGGFPGEWEGEHPMDTVARLGARDVFLAGWHGHDELPSFLNAADAVVLPSVREQFGQVLVEGMACGLPAVAADAHGPAEIVEDGATGWLVVPDDAGDLARALAEVAADRHERERRGRLALAVARERYAWPALAERVAAVYADVRESTSPGRVQYTIRPRP
jgi:glycosyltransferase involved in cell wall biosynthesis